MHYASLRSNKALYKKYGVSKSVISSVSFEDFDHSNDELPWLDQEDAMKDLISNPEFETFTSQEKQALETWVRDGYMILGGFLTHQACDEINKETADLIESSRVKFDYTNSRVMNIYKQSPIVNEFINNRRICRLLSFALGKKVSPFQTISFLKGSQQKTHSDSIHMTTQPPGYLAATWLALEDITMESGPLHYFPGSQKLPYIMNKDFDHGSTKLTVGQKLYANYELKIQEEIKNRRLEKQIFLPKKGDMLIWHANLLHGGEKRQNESSSRKSLVTHYFCEGDVICYHEITQRPAVKGKGKGCS